MGVSLKSDVKVELEDAARRYRRLRDATEDAGAERDRLVRKASELGLGRSVIAELAGLTVGRVQQIVSASVEPALPEASMAPQHMQALARANRVRLARAELKRAIARGDVDVAKVIHDDPWETESMTLGELLTSQRRWGRTRARSFLQDLPVREQSRVGSLTSAQRASLMAKLLDSDE